MAIDTLLPKKMDKSEASYKSVTELNEALSLAEKKHIRNIALTGPFGSGKSSVLITLMEDFANEHKFLPISLATLQANEEQIDDEKSEKKELDGKGSKSSVSTDTEQEKRIENLNRQTEYSILQQLIDEYFLTALCKLLFESIKRTNNLLCSTCRITHNALIKTAHNVFGVNWCYFLMQVNTKLERIGFKQYPSELVVCIAVELLVASE